MVGVGHSIVSVQATQVPVQLNGLGEGVVRVRPVVGSVGRDHGTHQEGVDVVVFFLGIIFIPGDDEESTSGEARVVGVHPSVHGGTSNGQASIVSVVIQVRGVVRELGQGTSVQIGGQLSRRHNLGANGGVVLHRREGNEGVVFAGIAADKLGSVANASVAFLVRFPGDEWIEKGCKLTRKRSWLP